MLAWLRNLFPRPPLPSAYIQSFLSGEIERSTFVSHIGDGWIGSDLGDWDWLKQVNEIEKRHNPDFPTGIGDVWLKPEAIEELRVLAIELRASGK